MKENWLFRNTNHFHVDIRYKWDIFYVLIYFCLYDFRFIRIYSDFSGKKSAGKIIKQQRRWKCMCIIIIFHYPEQRKWKIRRRSGVMNRNLRGSVHVTFERPTEISRQTIRTHKLSATRATVNGRIYNANNALRYPHSYTIHIPIIVIIIHVQ